MTFIMTYVDNHGSNLYHTLYDRFRKSISVYNPNAIVRVSSFEVKNEVKKDWRVKTCISEDARLARLAKDIVIISDVDMLQTGTINPIDLAGDWDIAVTVREQKFWLNSGVVLAKPTERAYAFLDKWASICESLMAKPELYKVYSDRYLFGDQAALGWMLENAADIAEVAFFPCSKWNLTQSEWHLFRPEESKLVHIKSNIRRVIEGKLRKENLKPYEQRILELWESYE